MKKQKKRKKSASKLKMKQSSNRLNFLDAVNKLIIYYNNQEHNQVVLLFEKLFNKVSVDEDKLMTREILSEVYVIAAFSYTEMGNFFKALEILEIFDPKMLQASYGKDVLYTFYLSYYQSHMFTNDLEKAIDSANQLILLKPEFATNYLRRGYAYLNGKRYAEAEPDLLKAMEMEPNWETTINLILFYLEIDQFNVALSYIEKAEAKYLQLPYQFPMAYLKVGVLSKLQRWEDTTNAIEGIYSIAPLNVPNYKIAILRLEGKRYEELYDITYHEVLKMTEDPRQL